MSKYYEFVNPYHFLPLGKNCEKVAWSQPEEERCTGYITVNLRNRTGMMVPAIRSGKRRDASEEETDGDSAEQVQEETVHFFNYSQEPDGWKNCPPVIPGSSVRGMLRSVYEMATDSCLSVIDSSRPVYRRISDPGEPSLLRRVKREDGKVEYQLYMGVEVKPVLITGAPPKSECELVDGGRAIFFKGAEFMRKRHYHKFIIPTKMGRIAVTDKMLEEFEKILSLYQDSGINKAPRHNHYKEYARKYDKFRMGWDMAEGEDEKYSREYFPVYAHQVRGASGYNHIYLTPAAISKEIFQNSIPEILKKSGHEPCVSRTKLCPACSLFGMVGQGGLKNNALKSNIRITDARWHPGEREAAPEHWEELYQEKDIVLEELSSPKSSSMEFYFKKPVDAESWNTDYYNKNGKICRNSDPEILGRKFYWHQGEEHHPVRGGEVEKSPRNSVVRLLKVGQEFEYKVFFQNITKRQLDQLIVLCNISNYEKKDQAQYGYRIGMGKPLGLGSCESTVREVKLRRWTDLSGGFCISPSYLDYQEVFGNGETGEKDWRELCYEDAGFAAGKDNFLLMLRFDAVSDLRDEHGNRIPVSYPLSLQDRGFEFFVRNRYGALSNRGGQYGRGGQNTRGVGSVTYSNRATLKREGMRIEQNLEPLNGEAQKLYVNGMQEVTLDKGKFPMANFYVDDEHAGQMRQVQRNPCGDHIQQRYGNNNEQRRNRNGSEQRRNDNVSQRNGNASKRKENGNISGYGRGYQDNRQGKHTPRKEKKQYY